LRPCWYGSRQHATAEKSLKMVNSVADSIATQSGKIFKQLDRSKEGPQKSPK